MKDGCRMTFLPVLPIIQSDGSSNIFFSFPFFLSTEKYVDLLSIEEPKVVDVGIHDGKELLGQLVPSLKEIGVVEAIHNLELTMPKT